MINFIKTSLILIIIMTVVTGVIYPGIVMIAQSFFPYQAKGSIVRHNGSVIGSELIGQKFASKQYFHSRPSAAGYNGAKSGGSNLAVSNNELVFRVNQQSSNLRFVNRNSAKVPVDMVTTSASGLDPHISLAAASFQAKRVAKARKLPVSEVQKLIKSHTEQKTLGIFGETKVNVLKLNLALDRIANGGRNNR